MSLNNTVILNELDALLEAMKNAYLTHNTSKTDVRIGWELACKSPSKKCAFQEYENVLGTILIFSKEKNIQTASVDYKNYFDLVTNLYIINYILQEIRTKKHSTFFDLHNTLPHDEFSLAGLLAYTFTQIEEDLLNVKEFVTLNKARGQYLEAEISIVAENIRQFLNGVIPFTPMYKDKNCEISQKDMFNGRWRTNHFTQTLLFGKVVGKDADLDQYPINKVFKQLQKVA